MDNPTPHQDRKPSASERQDPSLNQERLPEAFERLASEPVPEPATAPDLKVEPGDFAGEIQEDLGLGEAHAKDAKEPGLTPEAVEAIAEQQETLPPVPSPKNDLIDACRSAAADMADYAEAAARLLAEVPRLDTAQVQALTVDGLQDYVSRYRACEEAVSEAVLKARAIAEKLADKIVPDAEREYRARTGFIDDPTANSRIAVVSAVAGILLAGAGLFTAHHAIEGAIHHVATGIAGHLIEFVGGFFAMCGASAITSMAWGAFKTAVGRLMPGEGLENAKSQAAEVQGEIERAVEGASGEIHGLAGTLDEFSKITRQLKSSLSEVIISRSEGGISAPGAAKLAAIEDFARSLRWHEPIQTIQLYVAARRLNELDGVDVRPPESFWQSAYEAGPRAAMSAAKRAKKDCDSIEPEDGKTALQKLRNVFVGAGAGFGKSICGVLEMMVQGGVRMDEALLDTLKGGLSLANFGKDKKEGPSIPELLYMVAAGEEFEKGNYSKFAGELGPNVLLLVFKKIYFVVEAERKAAARGEVSPGLVQKDLQKKENLLVQAWKRMGEIVAKLPEATLGAITKNLWERPLQLFSGYPLCANLLNRWYNFRQRCEEHGIAKAWIPSLEGEGGMVKLERQLERTLPAGNSLRDMSYDDLKLHVMRRLVAYEKGEGGVTGQEIRGLLSYWEKRDKFEWLETQKRTVTQRSEIIAVDGDLAALPSAVARYNQGPDPKPVGWWQNSKSAVRSGLRWITGSKILDEYVKSYNAEERAPSKEPTVVASGNDGALVVHGEDGKLRLLKGKDARGFVLNECWNADSSGHTLPICVLPHADVARLASAERLLDLNTTTAQRTALLKAHYDALERGASASDISRRLAKAGYQLTQIFGANLEHDDQPKRCLMRSGLVGNRLFGEDELRKARAELSQEGFE